MQTKRIGVLSFKVHDSDQIIEHSETIFKNKRDELKEEVQGISMQLACGYAAQAGNLEGRVVELVNDYNRLLEIHEDLYNQYESLVKARESQLKLEVEHEK